MNTQSEAYSAESATSNSDLNWLADLKHFGLSKTTPTPKQSSENTGLQPRFTQTLRRQISQSYRKWTSLPEDSPAKTSATLANEQASRGIEVHYGNITSKPLGQYDRDTHSLKMYQHSPTGDSASSSPTLPKSGMMQNGIIYQLPQLVRLTAVKESSSSRILVGTPKTSERIRSEKFRKGRTPNPQEFAKMWPTPNAMDSMGARSEEALKKAQTKGGCRNLKDVLTHPTLYPPMWRTPSATELMRGIGKKSTEEKRNNNIQISLSAQVRENPAQTWPTPRSSEWKVDVNDSRQYAMRHQNRQMTALEVKRRAVAENSPITGNLNPDWVEWLMGFPEHWTETDEYTKAKKGKRQEQPQPPPPITQQTEKETCEIRKGIWAEEPNIPRVTASVKNRVDRIKCLGNAVVPQCAEIFAKAIKIQLEKEQKQAKPSTPTGENNHNATQNTHQKPNTKRQTPPQHRITDNRTHPRNPHHPRRKTK